MNFISFLNDLGIIPNKGTKAEGLPSLNQGQQFMDFYRMYGREADDIQSLQTTGLPGVSSIVEAMQENGTGSASVKNNKVSDLEDEFNRTLVEYNSTYKDFAEGVIRNVEADKEIQQYFGQVITSGDGNYDYVNDYGFTQKYSTDAWTSNAENCPKDPVQLSKDEISKFNVGAPMGESQPCGVAGKNVTNEETNEHAWVDIKGYKHVYSGDTWDKKSELCDVPSTPISDSEYSAIPSGGPMTAASSCEQSNVDPSVWNKLVELNQKLIDLAKQMSAQLSGVVAQDVRMQKSLNEEKIKLATYVASLDSEQTNLNSFNQNYVTVQGEKEDAELNANSNWLILLVYMVVTVLVVSLALKAASGPATRTNSILAVVASIFLLITLVRYMQR